MSQSEPTPETPLEGAALPAPSGLGLTPEVRRAFSDADRKCSVFIFPQLRQLGGTAVIADLTAAAQQLASASGSAESPAPELVSGYQALLAQAQAGLRQARAQEVGKEERTRSARRLETSLAAALGTARGQLPAARMARIQSDLARLPEEELEQRIALVEAAIGDWEKQGQVRQLREAERLADRAHRLIQVRPRQTRRSRQALRDQARIVELARSFRPESLAEGQEPPAQ
ncbi:MAG: hypothetical protein ACREOL_05450 [Candidatus Dormibacteria bacterium]